MKTSVRLWICMAALALLVVKAPLQEHITRFREDTPLAYGAPHAQVDKIRHDLEPSDWLILATGELLVYFRGILAFIMWMKSDEYWGGRHPEYDWFLLGVWQLVFFVIAFATWRNERDHDAKLIRAMRGSDGQAFP